MAQKFAHLHFHTQYSLLDGAIKVKPLPNILKEMSYESCAITDHGNMHGAIEFYKTMKGAGIKPIIGMEAYVAEGDRFRRSYAKPGPNAYHTVLICQNREGYENLTKMSSIAYTEGKFYGKPRIDRELLEKYNGGIIALSACLNGEVARRLLRGEDQEALEAALWYQQVFDGRYYIELQQNGLDDQNKVNPQLIKIARENNIPLVATNDCHYVSKEHAEAHYLLQLIGWQKKVTDPGVRGLDTSELYIKSQEQMIEDFKDFPEECISNTVKISDSCELDLSCNTYYLPDYPTEGGRTLEDELVKQSYERLDDRFEVLPKLYEWNEEETKQQKENYKKRLEYELGIINQMGFPGYFLIVADFINWSKDHDIPVGPGRGSGAGSLVAYCMRITDLDPMRYDLIFERFLNPERVSMPDFDVDFEVEGREDVINYTKEKYGEKNVCQISAIGSLQAKGALKSVARVLDVPYAEADKIAKLIPPELGISLAKALEKEPELKKMKDQGTEIEQKIIKNAMLLEGLNSNLSTHAAGVIIMNSDITDVMPTCTPSKGDAIQSQYTMKYAEDQGAVKFDFLGLRNLTIIQKALELINAGKPKEEQVDIELISLEDKPSYDLLCRGDTTGVFQLESSGMKALIQKLRPDCFEDIIALVALYRPGPLGSGMVDDYVECKHGRQEIKYPHHLLEPILKETNGVMVYQEQVMRSVQVLAGFSLGDADLLRRAIGKKIPEVLAEQRSRFVEGCAKQDIPADTSNYIFDLIDKFAGYGFNKSHAGAYALISYQTAWLKAHYPVEFMAALLTTDINNPDSIVKLVAECREMGIEVLPPDIMKSDMVFTTHGKQIRFGLSAIKNVGANALESIIEERNKQEFDSLIDIFTRIDSSKLNTRILEYMTKSGVFDSILQNRRQIFDGLDNILTIAAANRSLDTVDQCCFFEMLAEEEKEKSAPKLDLPDVHDWNKKTRLQYEKESLGFYISGHPLDPYKKDLELMKGLTNTAKIKEPERPLKPGEKVQMAGIIASNMVRLTKKGQKYSILQIDDLWGSVEVMVFPRCWDNVHQILDTDDPVLISGNINLNEDKTNIFAENIQLLSQVRNENSNSLNIEISEKIETEQISKVKALFEEHSGECNVNLIVTTEKDCKVKIQSKQGVTVSDQLVESLDEILETEDYYFSYRRTG